MVEEQNPAHSGPTPELHRILCRRMAERGLLGKLFADQVGIVNQHVSAVGQLERRWVVFTKAVRAETKCGGTMIGKVGHRGPSVTNPVSDGGATFVGDLSGHDIESFDVNPLAGECTRGESVERPASAQLVGPDGEEGRGHHSGQNGLGLFAGPLWRHEQGRSGVLAVPALEEGDPLHMVPVQVGEDNRSRKRSVAEHCPESAQSRTGVEQERRHWYGGCVEALIV